MREVTYQSTVKGGLPVLVHAEAESLDYGFYVVGLYVRRNGKLRSVWPSLYREIMADEEELRRLNEEADRAADWEEEE